MEEYISEKAIAVAAQCWCDPETSNIEMDTRLATAFAKRVENYLAEIDSLKIQLESLCKN